MPYTLEDAMRQHDQAFMDWIQTFHCDYNDIAGTPRLNVPCLSLKASPDRAFAQIPDLLVERGWIAGATDAERRDNAARFNIPPLPLISVTRLDPVPDPELSRSAGFVDKLELNHVTQKYIPHPWPRHYYTQYTVSFWALKSYTDNLFKAFIFGQMGRQGSNHNEVMIPVKHVEPWGEMFQRLRYDGSVDASDLEGENIRFIRVEYNFTLRTLVLQLPEAGNDYLDTLQHDTELTTTEFGDTVENGIVDEAPALAQSGNLWSVPMTPDRIPREWPVEGGATVRCSTLFPGQRWTRPNPRGLAVTVDGVDTRVELFERLARLDTAGQILVAFSFRYLSPSGPVTVEMHQRPGSDVTGDLTPIFSRTLPQTARWKRVQIFTIATETLFSASIAGQGSSGRREAQFVNLDVRYARGQSLIAPAVVGSGDPVVYEWAGLIAGKAYILRGLVTAGAGNMTVDNDTVSPSETTVTTLDADANVGVAVFVSPVSTSVRVSAPATLSLAGLSLSGYAGAHNGNEV